MKTFKDYYQMRVRQVRPFIFSLKLIKTKHSKEKVVFETISSRIPSTRELIGYYQQTSANKFINN